MLRHVAALLDVDAARMIDMGDSFDSTKAPLQREQRGRRQRHQHVEERSSTDHHMHDEPRGP